MQQGLAGFSSASFSVFSSYFVLCDVCTATRYWLPTNYKVGSSGNASNTLWADTVADRLKYQPPEAVQSIQIRKVQNHWRPLDRPAVISVAFVLTAL